MNYTLDSVHHFVETLKEEFPEFRDYTAKPILKGKGDIICEIKENVFYFGVYTTSSDEEVVTYVHMVKGGNFVVAPNTQVILGFKSTSVLDLQGNDIAPITTVLNQFRGFEITLTY